MNLARSGIFCGVLLFLLFLYGCLAERQLAVTFLDRVWMDEVFSTAALDAMRDSVQGTGAEAGLLKEVEPGRIWPRFLASGEVLFSGFDAAWAERIPAALLAAENGCYVYGRTYGWSGLLAWEEERTVQAVGLMEEAVRAGSREGEQFGILLPFGSQEGWAQALQENALIVLYDSGRFPSEERRYYRMAIGGAYRRNKLRFYVAEEGGEEVRVYHREGCRLLPADARLEVYPDMESCADKGAWPCPVCMRGTR